jgi:hypothetical protein
MASKYSCKCGFDTDDLKAFRTHLFRSGKTEGKGKHASLRPKASPLTSTKAQAAPIDIDSLMPGSGQVAASIMEEERILEQLKARFGGGVGVAVPPAVAQPPPAQQPTPKRDKRPGKPKDFSPLWRFLMISAGGILVVLGGAAAYYGNSLKAMPIIVLGVAVMATGGFITWKGIMRDFGGVPVTSFGNTPPVVIDKKGRAIAVKPNSFNIYPDRISNEYTQDAPGVMWRFRRDGNEYHLNIQHKDSVEMERFTLPDTIWIDPKLAAVPLFMPANRRLYRRRKENILKQLTPMAIVLAMLIVAFLMITMQKPATEPAAKPAATHGVIYRG